MRKVLGRNNRRLNERIRKQIEPYLYMLGFLVLTTVFLVYPICYAVYVSLHRTSYIKIIEFIGLKNYATFFLGLSGLVSIYRSFQYVGGSLATVLLLGIFLALILNRISHFRTGFRLIVFLPWTFSQTVAALLWIWLYNQDYGPINSILATLGYKRLGFLTDSSLAMLSLIVTNVWISYPIAVIFVLAGLQNIPPSLYEAAKLDGASNWRSFLHITLPLLQSTVMVTLLLLTVMYFNMVPLIYIMTGGGPFYSTQVLSLSAYQQSFDFWKMGYGTSIGIIILGFNISFGLLYRKVLAAKNF